MSESGEGVPVPEDAKTPKVELDEFGQIKGQPSDSNKTVEPFHDRDDNEDRDLRPAQSLANLKDRLARATPVTAVSGEVGPVTDEAKNAKPANVVQKTEEVVRQQTIPPGQVLNRYANPVPPQTGQRVDKKA